MLPFNKFATIALLLELLANVGTLEFKDKSLRRSYTGYKVFRHETKAPGDMLRDVEQMLSKGYSIWNLDATAGTIDFAVPPTALLEGGLTNLEMVVPDVEAVYEFERIAVESRKEKFVKLGRSRAVDFDVENYHRHSEINQYLLDLEAEYESVSTEVIGQSYEGRDMIVLKFCQGECGQNPIMWVDGGIHAREWIGSATTLYTMETLIQALPEGDEDLLGVDWYFLPVFNPDGYEFTWDVDRNWRKTRRILEEVDTICVGVDPNRNFGYMWGVIEPGSTSTSTDPCSTTYQGSEPWTEPELVNVRDYIQDMSPKPVFFVDMHSPTRAILYPYGYTCDISVNPDNEDQNAMAAKGNDAVEAVNGNRYFMGDSCNRLYQTSGNSVDWAYGEQGIKYSYTMELRPGSEFELMGYVVPPEEIEGQALEMYAFLASAARDIMEEFSERTS